MSSIFFNTWVFHLAELYIVILLLSATSFHELNKSAIKSNRSFCYLSKRCLIIYKKIAKKIKKNYTCGQ